MDRRPRPRRTWPIALLAGLGGCRLSCADAADAPLYVGACLKPLAWPSAPASQAPFPASLGPSDGGALEWAKKSYPLAVHASDDTTEAEKAFAAAGAALPLKGASPICKVTGDPGQPFTATVGAATVRGTLSKTSVAYFVLPGLSLAPGAGLLVSGTRFEAHPCVRATRWLPFESCGSTHFVTPGQGKFGPAFPATAAGAIRVECRGLTPEAQSAALAADQRRVEAAFRTVCESITKVGGAASPDDVFRALADAASWVGWADPRIAAAKAHYDELARAWLEALRKKAAEPGTPAELSKDYPSMTLKGPLRCDADAAKRAGDRRPAKPGNTWCVLELSLSAPPGKERKVSLSNGSIEAAPNFWAIGLDLVLADGTLAELVEPGFDSGDKVADVAGKTQSASWLVEVPSPQAVPGPTHVLRLKADKGYAFLSTGR